jgi:DNA-directed RNA polymerase specialized sigma24 family protein
VQTFTLKGVLDHLRRHTGTAAMKDLSDAELLERFCGRREEAAFALLVQRHGPAVLGVCRRVLGDVHAAEDAFQATFLVLVRKAGRVRKRDSLGSFLNSVA